MISKCRFIFTDFCVIIWFFTKLLISRILYSTAVNTVFVGKPLILGILFSVSLILVSCSDLLTSPLVSGIVFSDCFACQKTVFFGF